MVTNKVKYFESASIENLWYHIPSFNSLNVLSNETKVYIYYNTLY